MPDIAYIDGEYKPISEATISINDRGLLFGDAVYATIAAFNRKPFLLDRHLSRLESSCKELGIEASAIIEALYDIIPSGTRMSEYENCLIYAQLSRGAHPRDIFIDENIEPHFFVTFRELKVSQTAKYRENGVNVILRPDLRGKRCDIKGVSLLPLMLMRNEARKENAFDAILYKDDGTIAEGCSSSVFFVKSNTLITRPLSQALIPGITRKYVIDVIAPRLGYSVVTEEFGKDSLMRAEEVFLSMTTALIVPVISIDGEKIGSGVPGEVTKKITACLLKEIDLQTA
ncbi:MAG: aminotransferase class IV [Deltaproteobacteria bacterium]|nr:aminotransferase class IV [Deltaproteobacteria bacterium]